MEIRNKREFFTLWKLGVLGNRTNLWDNIDDALDSSAKEIGFRELGKSGGGAWEKAPRSLAREVSERWTKLGRKFIMDDGAPDDRRTLCGEVCRTHRGLEGILGIVQMPMREAIKRGLLKPVRGLEVNVLLDRYMDPSSRDDLDSLLELFPDAVVEFSCFTVNVGAFPRRNTIFWEVRNY